MPAPRLVPLNPDPVDPAPAIVKGRAPRAPGDLETTAQNTFILAPDQIIAFGHPQNYAQPSFMCSILNTGPGAISVRWDGKDAVFGSIDCILLPVGTGYADAVTTRMSIAADGAGATVSISCDPHYG